MERAEFRSKGCILKLFVPIVFLNFLDLLAESWRIKKTIYRGKG
jgi:hypothetical protein